MEGVKAFVEELKNSTLIKTNDNTSTLDSPNDTTTCNSKIFKNTSN